ncbi:N-acetylgalactosamine-6-phosphate deacetylase [Roseobacter fucihabitans]|uniref:N-acetylgalactosamine-6-phosphate deacetylase n=1 Tax=Roseobacter fucihabitans TaxID=1537242 RepID=A0ABZ2BQ04_9RHOB|nr:N-acetylglucosamine-6-phosphate deacetylase [Roseobacter litoralis]MBC6965366.1 N-acetylglucosamine-6-phosphate deacetylase [Roseobacter litoralis]MBC6965468.1 N-acetylglucosamine-6-phosphate deacetylase [Roseobacter litoralis]
MSRNVTAYVGAQIHDGQQLHEDHALIIAPEGHVAIKHIRDLPTGCGVQMLDGGLITPGFVDLQVNGGGGVMFNDDQSVAGLRTIARAHAASGTCALLPTLITDTPARTRAAIDAIAQAIEQSVPGIIGIHLEGPHLSVARKGAHDPARIRVMTDEDLDLMLQAAANLPDVMVTVAPENVTNAQITIMAEAGIIVSLGHTDADIDTCLSAFDAGARCVTHLFNAMSQMGNRAPGLVGATLMREDVHAGLIADGIHVHPATMRVALAAKPGPGQIFLVTDAMATAGSQIDRFMLNGREVFRKDARLTLADGTLAGADLEMPRALSVLVDDVGQDISTAVARATSAPAALLRQSDRLAHITGDLQSPLYFKDGFSSPQRLNADP